MFWESFGITASGVVQGFILGAIGFFLIKRNLLGEEGLSALSRLVLEVTLPLMIFCRLLSDFSFSLFPDWWIYPVASLVITSAGLLAGFSLSGFIKGAQEKTQFVSLIAFQNSGYLPLVLAASLLSADKASPMFIYLFLFLVAFNLVMFSAGVYFLTFSKGKKFDWWSLLNPPVAATLIGFISVAAGLSRFIPAWVIKPLQLTGDCTLPLAMFVVGGNLAAIHLGKVHIKPLVLTVLAKLLILPSLGLLFVIYTRPPELLGLLIIMQLAMPPATNLSVLMTQYRRQDILVSEGIFYCHIISMITIPVFLSLYFTMTVLK